MASVLAFVPAQAGATYLWSVNGGTIPGVDQNAAVYFNAGAASTPTRAVRGHPERRADRLHPGHPGGARPAGDLLLLRVGPGRRRPRQHRAGRAQPEQRELPVPGQARQRAEGHPGVLHLVPGEDPATRRARAAPSRWTSRPTTTPPPTCPPGASLATVSYGNIIAQNNNYPELPFPYPAILTAAASTTWCSPTWTPPPPPTTFPWTASTPTPRPRPCSPAIDRQPASPRCCVPGSGAWKLRQGFTPTLELDYADGGSQGNGYMEVWSTNPRPSPATPRSGRPSR